MASPSINVNEREGEVNICNKTSARPEGRPYERGGV